MTATTPATAAPEVPQPGRVVQVRGSTWAVKDVQEQALSRSPADESIAGCPNQVSPGAARPRPETSASTAADGSTTTDS